MGKIGAPTGPPRVVDLHRYPVKSMLGERLAALDMDDRGVAGDRCWSVMTAQGKIGSGKDTRRFAAVPNLQLARANFRGDRPWVTLPDGFTAIAGTPSLDERLSVLTGQAVALRPEAGVSHFDDGPVSLVARASVQAVSDHRGQAVAAERFRSNLVLDGVAPFGEEAWVGKLLRIGAVALVVEMASPRCRMIDDPTAELEAQPGNLRAVGQLNQGRLGVVARVVQAGSIQVGAHIEVE